MQDINAPEALQDFQINYGRYLRDPKAQTLPRGIPRRRSEIYENLLFNNLCGFVDKCFPVACSLFSEAEWEKLCRRFFAEWRCSTPIFSQIPREFVSFIADTFIGDELPPWLPELLHYEWVELEVDLDESELPKITGQGKLHGNPSLRLLAYQWPVHKISQDFLPDTEEETYLVVYRDHELQVRFLEVNATTFTLIQFICTYDGSEDELFSSFAQTIQHPDPEALAAFGLPLIHDLTQQEIFIGV